MTAPDEVRSDVDTGMDGIPLGDLGLMVPVAPTSDTTDEISPPARLSAGPAAFRSPPDPGLIARNARTRLAIDRLIAEIDRALSDQVDAILHHPKFQRLEASWRGLIWIVRAADGVKGVRVRILNMTWNEVTRDIDRALEFDQSMLFDKIYTQEFDTPGGTPYGMIIGDYEVTKHPRDIATLRGLAGVVASAHAPMVMGCAASLFGLDGFRELTPTIDLSGIFERGEFSGWRQMRASSEDMRYLGGVLPRVVLRLPWRSDGGQAEGFVYDETTHERDARGWLWGSAAYALGVVVLRSYATYSWFVDIRGAGRDLPGGGLVDDMPVPWYRTDRVGVGSRLPVEVALSDRQEKELSDLGFIPLVPARLTPFAVFHSNQSAWLAPRYDKPAARVNARLSSMLQQVLCASRFAHFIKVMARDEVGSFRTATEIRRKLVDWIGQYCQRNDQASLEVKARFPLREAEIDVKELPSRPGSFTLVVRLQPQFQLDEIGASFNLVSTVRTREAA